MSTLGHVLERRRFVSESALRLPPPTILWTIVGATAIPLWATWPLLAAVTATSVPLFQYLSLIFAAGAGSLWLLRTGSGGSVWGHRSGERGAKGSVWLAAIMVCVGLLFSDVLFLLALRHIPAAQANLLLYLWPVMVVLLGKALGLAKLTVWGLVGIMLGLFGAIAIFEAGGTGLSPIGALLALGGGFVWALFVVFRMWQGPNAPDALARGLALSAAVAFLLHVIFESWTWPSLGAFALIMAVGVVPLALGNLAWDHGIRKGDKMMLATMAYATPLVSATFLIIAGFAIPTVSLAVGAVLIVAAGLVASRQA